ncbi:hypothetical protein TTHERM_00355820 (macronuclear) [Tetrahymena thermophila SB210]|uniref:Uncharacterized protein n=1 Tax=Tetrahymena thermophila (strain SB210) TaxID=312017 RepID=Q22XY9_TETTS|nr:hypothetical protein TTHERM_00355820 [Tetrahymena thermophila SB210]EAR90235.2 hypothetical protein TTHERM_00355820 [Tetrahymena thermophila SB210]|eukprot:XP_001010480.2 hypothetical protein TTHERM_00355820 [Tetrahymena thermophila SB210]
MNFQLSSSQAAKHKWQIPDQQQEISNSMNELRKGIRTNVTEKVIGYNKFFDSSKMNTEVSNSSYVNYQNQPQKESQLLQQFHQQQQPQAQQQFSPVNKRLFEKINYDSLGQQNQQQQSQQQSRELHSLHQQQQQYSPLKLSHKFYSPRAVPSFDGLQRNLKDHSASKVQPQSQNFFKNEKSSLASSLWGDAPQNSQQKSFVQNERAYNSQSSQQANSPPRFSQVQKSIETLGQKQQQQQQQSNGLKGIFDFQQRKLSVQPQSPAQTKTVGLLSEMDFFKKRDNSKSAVQSSSSAIQNKLSTSLFESKKKDTLSESFSLKSGALTTKNAQVSPRKLSAGSFSNLNSIKRSSLNPSQNLLSQISNTPLRRSQERNVFSSSSGLGFSSPQVKKLVDRVPITKVTEIRSHVENTLPQELASLPSTYVEELTRLAASITKALKSTKFYERSYY